MHHRPGPVRGKNYNALLRAITRDDPPSITDFAAGDDDLWRVLERGLRKEKMQRWSSMWEFGEALALWLYEQGVREDICANSLRKSWLESGISGVQVDLESEAPPPASRGSSTLTGSTAPEALPIQISDSDFPPSRPAIRGATLDGTDSAPFEKTGSGRAWLRIALPVAALLGVGALGWFAFRRPTSPPVEAAAGSAPAATEELGEVTEPAVTEPTVAEPAPPPSASATMGEGPQQPETSKPASRGFRGWRPSSKVSAPAPSAAPEPAAPKPAAPKPKPSPSKKPAAKERDFGF